MSTDSLYPGISDGGGVSVNSIIQDKIREYMMQDSPNEPNLKQQTKISNSAQSHEKTVSNIPNKNLSIDSTTSNTNRNNTVTKNRKQKLNLGLKKDSKNSALDKGIECKTPEANSVMIKPSSSDEDKGIYINSDEAGLDNNSDSDHSNPKFLHKKAYQKNYSRKKNSEKIAIGKYYCIEDNSNSSSNSNYSTSSGDYINGMYVAETECKPPKNQNSVEIASLNNNNIEEDTTTAPTLLTNGLKSAIPAAESVDKELNNETDKTDVEKNDEETVAKTADTAKEEDGVQKNEEIPNLEEKNESNPTSPIIANGGNHDDSSDSMDSCDAEVNGIEEDVPLVVEKVDEELEENNIGDEKELTTITEEEEPMEQDEDVEESKLEVDDDVVDDNRRSTSEQQKSSEEMNEEITKLSSAENPNVGDENRNSEIAKSTVDDEEGSEEEKIEEPVEKLVTPPLVDATKSEESVVNSDQSKSLDEVEESKSEQAKSDAASVIKSEPFFDNSSAVKENAEVVTSRNDDKVGKDLSTTKRSQLQDEKNINNNNIGVACKRRIEDAGDSFRDSASSSSEGGDDSKRIRFDESIFEEDERERLIREFVDKSAENTDDITKHYNKLQQEIGALTDLAKAKELEWNSIMRLLKLKEEMLERILFKKRQSEFINGKATIDFESNISKMYKNFVSNDQTKGSGRSETANTGGSSGAHITSNNVSIVANHPAAAASGSNNSISNATPVSSQSEYYKLPPSSVYGPDVYAKILRLNNTTNHNSNNNNNNNRPILPKPNAASTPSAAAQAAAVNSMMMAAAAAAADQQNSVIGEGRQGAILDVKSIIADFRSKNPADVQPRRGRRLLTATNARLDGNPIQAPRFLGNTSLLSMANMALGSGSHVRTSVSSTTHQDHPATANSYLMAGGQDGGSGPIPTAAILKSELQMRRSPSLTVSPNIEAIMMNSAAAGPNAASSHQSFQEALVKFAKMNERRDSSSTNPSSSTTSCTPIPIGSSSSAAANIMQHHHPQLLAQQQNKAASSQHLPPPPPYPEVTLHPVLAPQLSSSSPSVQNSLLHGILTKSNNQQQQQQHHQHQLQQQQQHLNSVATSLANSIIQHRPTTFSPTLARLLTAPERSRSSRNVNSSARGSSTKSTLNEILTKKGRTEVTITPVTNNTNMATVSKNNNDVIQLQDDEDEGEDRLVIDEGRENNGDVGASVIPADKVPECQGCHKKSAQFVCAGCGNQWYCSRECQVQAWEDHSESCSG